MFSATISDRKIARPEVPAVLCPFCKSSVRNEAAIVRCRHCGTAHHQSCWSQYGRCTVFGCPGLLERTDDNESRKYIYFIPAILFYLSSLNPTIASMLMSLLLPAFILSIATVIFLSRDLRRAFVYRNSSSAEIRNNLILLILNFLALGIGFFHLFLGRAQ